IVFALEPCQVWFVRSCRSHTSPSSVSQRTSSNELPLRIRSKDFPSVIFRVRLYRLNGNGDRSLDRCACRKRQYTRCHMACTACARYKTRPSCTEESRHEVAQDALIPALYRCVQFAVSKQFD